MLLDGKVAIVTGAASARGIGKGTARLFASQGARVVILDLDANAAAAAAAELGPQHAGLACDVTDKAACVRAADDVLIRSGRIDILVNNAGVTQPKRITDIEAADYDFVTGVSLRGTLYMSQAVIPAMRAQRSLGEVSDVAGCCLFLASDLSVYVTGATLDVNGGMHIH